MYVYFKGRNVNLPERKEIQFNTFRCHFHVCHVLMFVCGFPAELTSFSGLWTSIFLNKESLVNRFWNVKFTATSLVFKKNKIRYK